MFQSQPHSYKNGNDNKKISGKSLNSFIIHNTILSVSLSIPSHSVMHIKCNVNFFHIHKSTQKQSSARRQRHENWMLLTFFSSFMFTCCSGIRKRFLETQNIVKSANKVKVCVNDILSTIYEKNFPRKSTKVFKKNRRNIHSYSEIKDDRTLSSCSI